MSVRQVKECLGYQKELVLKARELLNQHPNQPLKKNEILQLLTLNPKLAILDETDSGLDVDAIRIVSKGIETETNKLMSEIVFEETKIYGNIVLVVDEMSMVEIFLMNYLVTALFLGTKIRA